MSGTDTESRSAGLRRAWLLRLGTSSVVLVAWFLIFAVGAVALLLFDPVFCATS